MPREMKGLRGATVTQLAGEVTAWPILPGRLRSQNGAPDFTASSLTSHVSVNQRPARFALGDARRADGLLTSLYQGGLRGGVVGV